MPENSVDQNRNGATVDSANNNNNHRNNTNHNNVYVNQSFVPEIILSQSDGDDATLKKSHAVDDDGLGQIKSDIDFDDLLPHIGEFGRYQKILFFLMIPFAFFVAFVYFAQIFITLVPEEHWCRVPELDDLTLDAR